MKKRVCAVFLAMTMVAMTGCGAVTFADKSAAIILENEAAKAAAPEAVTSGEYVRRDGYTVRYNPEEFAFNEGDDSISFVYQGKCAGTTMLTIKYVKDKYPDEVIKELTDTWGVPDKLERWEGIFPGTTDKWGYYRRKEAAGHLDIEETAICGEYNGGALLFNISMTQSDDEDADYNEADIKAALSEIIDSITYDNFEEQAMYSYIPGTYKMEFSDEIDGQVTYAEYSVTLNKDHTGVIRLQDDVNVLWGSYELTAEDGSFVYEYNVAGDTLMINYDGNWITFDEKVQE